MNAGKVSRKEDDTDMKPYIKVIIALAGISSIYDKSSNRTKLNARDTSSSATATVFPKRTLL
jgi:hypothetical protein